MGSCQSAEVAAQNAHSKHIDRELNGNPLRIIQKLLLLGPAESGKSTCVKQMQILHTNGFSEVELDERKSLIYSNVVRGMMELLDGMSHLGIPFEDSSVKNDELALIKHIEDGLEFSAFSSNIKYALQRLWRDCKHKNLFNQVYVLAGVKRAFEERSGFQYMDSTK